MSTMIKPNDREVKIANPFNHEIVNGIISIWTLIKRKLKWQSKTLIIIQGHLSGKWKECFEGMEISYEGNNTILTGNLKDEAHMYGILNIVRDHNLILISANSVKSKLMYRANKTETK